jgi:hypothetical protein
MSRGISIKRTIEALAAVARETHAAGFTVKLPDGLEVTWNATEADTAQTDEPPINDFDTILERKKKRRETQP